MFEWLHISDWVKPIANVLVSNIPGPKQQKYFKDSKLLACYPISLSLMMTALLPRFRLHQTTVAQLRKAIEHHSMANLTLPAARGDI